MVLSLLHVALQQHLLLLSVISDPNPNPSTYPRTCLRASDCLCLKNYVWIHYREQVNGIFCRASIIFVPETKKVDKCQDGL